MILFYADPVEYLSVVIWIYWYIATLTASPFSQTQLKNYANDFLYFA